MQDAFNTIGDKSSVFDIVREDRFGFSRKAKLVFGSESSYEWSNEMLRIAQRDLAETMQRHDERVQIWSATQNMKASEIQLKASEQFKEAAELMAKTTTQATQPIIQPSFSNGYQGWSGQQQMLEPQNMFNSGVEHAQSLHNTFIQDWSNMSDFSKNNYFQFPDSLPHLLPQYAQAWHQLPENLQNLASVDPLNFLTNFPASF